MLGLRFCARALSSCSERGPLFIAVHGPLAIAASLVAEQRLQTRRLSSCGPWAQLLRGMWDPPRPGLEPMSPALAGRLSTTEPPGKPQEVFLKIIISLLLHSKHYMKLILGIRWYCMNLLSVFHLKVSSESLPRQSHMYFLFSHFKIFLLIFSIFLKISKLYIKYISFFVS